MTMSFKGLLVFLVAVSLFEIKGAPFARADIYIGNGVISQSALAGASPGVTPVATPGTLPEVVGRGILPSPSPLPSGSSSGAPGPHITPQ